MPDARGKKSAQVLSDESNYPTSLGRSDFFLPNKNGGFRIRRCFVSNCEKLNLPYVAGPSTSQG